MRESDPAANQPPDLIVIGHQWWWEVRYPQTGVVTANEIHIPIGRKWLVRLESSDVIHDFWAVSYTHLDVYKRQDKGCRTRFFGG